MAQSAQHRKAALSNDCLEPTLSHSYCNPVAREGIDIPDARDKLVKSSTDRQGLKKSPQSLGAAEGTPQFSAKRSRM